MRGKRSNSNSSKLGAISIILALVIIFTGFNVFKHYKYKSDIKKAFASKFEVTEENKHIGKIESNIKYGKDSVLSVHYPKTGNKDLDDKIINDFINPKLEDFSKLAKDFPGKKVETIPSLNIDYASSPYGEDIANIEFTISENLPNGGINRQYTERIVYNLKDNKDFTLDDFVIEEGLDKVNRLAKENFKSKEDIQNYFNDEIISTINDENTKFDDFILKEDSIEFVVPSGKFFPEELGEFRTQVDYQDIEKYTKYDTETMLALSEEAIQEKIDKANLEFTTREHLDPNKPMIALTFDDGPYENVTGPILDKLKEYNSVGTFFVLGNKVAQNADLIKRAADEGNEIANHSFNHKQLTAISVDELNYQVRQTQEEIANVIGYEPKLLRPTYGAINDNVRKHTNMPLILWSIDTLDWKHRDANRVANHIMTNVRDGDIILMHDLYPSTAQATLSVIPQLIDRGFQLVTVSELYELKGIELENGVSYTNVKPQ